MEQKPTVYILVGISGSGKSTWTAALKDKLRAEVINMDSIRAELTGDPSDQSKNAQAYVIAITRYMNALNRGVSVIWDNTTCKVRDRKSLLPSAKNFNYKKVAIYFDSDILTAKIRNAARDRKVPDFVIDKQFAALSRPIFDEGFDEIQVMHVDNPDYVPTCL